MGHGQDTMERQMSAGRSSGSRHLGGLVAMGKMKNTIRVAVAMAAVGLLAGCPGTDVFELDNSSLSSQLTITNSNLSRYETFTSRVAQITLVPVDPVTRGAVGVPFALLPRPVTVDFNGSGNTYEAVPLKAGTYQVEEIVITPVALRDDDPPLVPANCVEGLVNPGPDAMLGTADDFSEVPDSRAVTQPTQYSFTEFGNDGIATVTDGGSLTVNIDAQALRVAFEGALGCVPAVNDSCGTYTSRSCNTFLAANIFQADSASFITFN